MNVFNVHSNRSPVDGVVSKRVVSRRQLRQRGARQGVARERAQCAAHRAPPAGVDVTCVQVAGLIARRILCYVKPGDALARGQRYGFIRFGSRVDVYLPPTRRRGRRRRHGRTRPTTVLAELPLSAVRSRVVRAGASC